MSREGLSARTILTDFGPGLDSAFDVALSPTHFPKAIAVAVLGLVVPLILSACSVGMAMSGQDDPNVEFIQVGSNRLDVEGELGAPHSSALLDDGQLQAIYRYEIGNEPSPARAVMHGVADILTFGIWEVVGTSIEGMQGTTYEATIVYDAESEVKSIEIVSVDEQTDPAPSEEQPKVADVERWIDENGSLLERRLNEFLSLEKVEKDSRKVRVFSYEVIGDRGDRFLIRIEFGDARSSSSESSKVEIFSAAFDSQGVRIVELEESGQS